MKITKKLEKIILTILSTPVVMGAQVVDESAPVAVIDTFGMVMGFFKKFWKFALWGTIIFIACLIIYYLLKKMDDTRRERDEPGYQVYKALKKTCMLQADKRKIRRNWSPINLLWLGLPIIKREHSCKFLDMSNKILGWYRGESSSMDNSINFLTYKRKFFILFEETFIIKVPQIIRFKSKDKKTDKEKSHTIDLTRHMKELPNGDIKIDCVGLEKLGLYYYCPVFVIDEEHGKLDYRKVVEGSIIDTTYQAMLQRVVNASAKAVEKATLISPDVQAKRLTPEKTKEEVRAEGGIT